MTSNKDRRRFKRYKHKSEFRLSIEGTSYQARTVDFSIGGIGFSVEGTPPLTKGAMIALEVEDLTMNIDGKIAFQNRNKFQSTIAS